MARRGLERFSDVYKFKEIDEMNIKKKKTVQKEKNKADELGDIIEDLDKILREDLGKELKDDEHNGFSAPLEEQTYKLEGMTGEEIEAEVEVIEKELSDPEKSEDILNRINNLFR